MISQTPIDPYIMVITPVVFSLMRFVTSIISCIVVASALHGCGSTGDDANTKHLEVVWVHWTTVDAPALTGDTAKSFEVLKAVKEEDFTKVATPFVAAKLNDQKSYDQFHTVHDQNGMKFTQFKGETQENKDKIVKGKVGELRKYITNTEIPKPATPATA